MPDKVPTNHYKIQQLSIDQHRFTVILNGEPIGYVIGFSQTLAYVESQANPGDRITIQVEYEKR